MSFNLVAIDFRDSITRLDASTELSGTIGNKIGNDETAVGFRAEHDPHTTFTANKAGLLAWADMMVQAFGILVTATLSKLGFRHGTWSLQIGQSLKLNPVLE